MILLVDVGINHFYKIIMDQIIYLSAKCTICIIAVNNILAGESFEHSLQTARDKIKGIMFTAWKFWPLVHCITYSVIPVRHRILWVKCVDLFWNAILELKTNSAGDEDDIDAVAMKEVLIEDAALLESTGGQVGSSSFRPLKKDDLVLKVKRYIGNVWSEK